MIGEYQENEAIKNGREQAEEDLAEGLAESVQEALRMLGATIGTDADEDELLMVATYAETVLVKVSDGQAELGGVRVCPECRTTSLTSDRGLGCINCGY